MAFVHLKYIIVKDEKDKEYAIVFPKAIIHKHVARIHRATDTRVISAGFCELSTIATWGRSDSLNMDSRPEDTEILKESLTKET
jgi:hypothetical protein